MTNQQAESKFLQAGCAGEDNG